MNSATAPAPLAAPGTAPARATQGAYLACQGVGKLFGSVAALTDIDLAVAEGEMVSFLGPSGCGKTTLLRAIAGLDPPSRGVITQGGRDITALPPDQRDFGIVFQSYALFPNLTVNANVAYGLRGPAWPKARAVARVAELLATVGLTEHAEKYPAQLSGGQQQRVALARALANEPGLLLLDEPLSALDAIVRLHLRTEIRALQQRLGVTTILVTHDQEEAMSVSDRIVVMSRGRIEQVGTPEEIYDQPASAFVANFVGRSAAFDAVVDPRPATLAVDGLLLPADGARGHAPGAEVRAFVRPEAVRLGAAAQGLPDALPMQVVGIEFLGASCRVSLAAERFRLEADAPPQALKAAGVALGATLPVAVPAASVMVFPKDV